MAGRTRLLACSFHCQVDPSSGATQSLRDLLSLLDVRGWDSEVFCGPHLDYGQERTTLDVLAAEGLPAEVRSCDVGPSPFTLIHSRRGPVPLTLYLPGRAEISPSITDAFAFVALLERKLLAFRPDLVLTYGGNWIGRAIISCAKRRGLPVVFWLRNCAYFAPAFFAPVDGVIVPCAFSRDYYRRTLGLECAAIASPVDWSRCRCDHVERRLVTFVNPEPAKGVFVFAAIAREMRRLRPDIRFLVVEGRAGVEWLHRAGVDPQAMGNIQVMPNTPDPRQFYSKSRLVLMPSLWQETFSRVPVEALVNGIPVLASSRGGLGENLAQAGFLFDVPAQYTEQTLTHPTAEEVAPWVRTIIQLWDDAEFYEDQRQRCLRAAEEFHPDRLGRLHEEYLLQVMSRPPRAHIVGNEQDVLTTLVGFIETPEARARASSLSTELLDGLLA